MQHLEKFIIEVQTIEIRVKEYYVENGKIFTKWTPEEVPDYNLPSVTFLDLSHYHQKKSNYETELKRLQQSAITDAMNLTTNQLNMHLNRLILLKNKYKTFWTLYKEYLKNPSKSTLFEYDVNNLFIISKPPQPNPHRNYSPSYYYVRDWHDAIMFKEGYLVQFEKQIRKILESVLVPQQTGELSIVEPMTLNYDSNYFNEVCYKLFLYLNEKYNKGGKIKYINIFYFLKSIAGEMQDRYQFTIKINDYKSFIWEKFETEIKKFQKAEFAYEEKELPKLKNILKDFEKSLK